MKKIGIYGGTFDPVHEGHVRAARAFLSYVRPDRLLVVPTFIPPHKTISHPDDPEARLKMLDLVFSGDEFRDTVEVCDFEIRKGAKSYTVETLEHFSTKDTSLVFLCGTDMFFTLGEWKNPEKIFSLASIAFMRREKVRDGIEEKIHHYTELYKKEFGANIIRIPEDPIEVTSTEVRALYEQGLPTTGLVPRAADEFIRQNHMYGS